MIGNKQILIYWVIYFVGFLISYLFLLYAIKKGRIKNLSVKQGIIYILGCLVAVTLFSRLFYIVFYYTSYPIVKIMLKDPLYIIKFWQGGMSFHGGLIGVIFFTYVYCKIYKINFFQITDILSLPAILSLAFGRIGNLLNHEIYGKITDVPWCMRFIDWVKCLRTGGFYMDTHLNDCMTYFPECRHPYQIYAFISHIILFFILYWMYFRKNLWKNTGLISLSFAFFYGLFRFITDFFREEPTFIGINMGQILSLLMMLISLEQLISEYKILKNFKFLRR